MCTHVNSLYDENHYHHDDDNDIHERFTKVQRGHSNDPSSSKCAGCVEPPAAYLGTT